MLNKNFEYPKTIPICLDDDEASHIGRTADGRQFMLTEPFSPARAFVALYTFDEGGALLDANIVELGRRKSVEEADVQQICEDLLDSLGDKEYCDIRIGQFSIQRFGLTFGLIPVDERDIDEDDERALEFHPGNYMAFYDPWDGEYCT